MKSVSQHIEHIKSQPHHIRKRIAFGAAAVGTGIIAFIWLAGSLATGVFALKATSFADRADGNGTIVVSSDNKQQVAGVGAASVIQDEQAPARIEIIDAVPPTLPSKKSEQTTIPF